MVLTGSNACCSIKVGMTGFETQEKYKKKKIKHLNTSKIHQFKREKKYMSIYIGKIKYSCKRKSKSWCYINVNSPQVNSLIREAGFPGDGLDIPPTTASPTRSQPIYFLIINVNIQFATDLPLFKKCS
jgi:hypothetical protein